MGGWTHTHEYSDVNGCIRFYTQFECAKTYMNMEGWIYTGRRVIACLYTRMYGRRDT